MSTTTIEETGGPAAELSAEHPEYLQHHFDSPGQQQAASKLGMWIFLSTEVLMFSGLFLAYGIARYLYPDMMLRAHEHLDVALGSVNTVVLITSSLTMALAVRAAQVGNQRALQANLLATILLACVFLVIKYFEYSAKLEHGLLPGVAYSAGEPFPGGPQLFFGIYFMMTGLHGLHVLAGIIVLTMLLRRSQSGKYHARYYTPVENVGLYWHLVDVVWIFLFPLLYLVK